MDFEWEIITDSRSGDLELQQPRKICRTSILNHLSGAYDRCELGEPTLTDQIFSIIPPEGITASSLSELLNAKLSMVFNSLGVLRRRGKIMSVKVNGKHTKYFKVEENIFETLALPYRPKHPREL
jgi:hypothetical protein